ncbi:MAG TPA: flagellin [Firmicutes bacterium]|nr:flagellin [Bacillota bacterium]
MRINNNIMALNAHRQLGMNQTAASKSMEKLSSGFRINRAGDDAAGLAISEKMRGQIRGLKQAQRNAQDGISLIQTAEGALNESHAILQRMRELAVQAGTDTNTAEDRKEIQNEIDELAKELTRIANDTEFNTQKLINGSITEDNLGELGFHVGANQNQRVFLGIGAMDAKSLQVHRDVIGAEVEDGAVQVTGAEVEGSPGAAIVDGAKIYISAQLVAGADTSAQITGGAATLTTDLSDVSADTVLTITVDGTDYTLDHTALITWDGEGDAEVAITLLGNAVDVDDKKLSTVATITGDETSGFTITTNSAGATSSVSISITGDNSTEVAAAFGLTDGLSGSGTDAGANTLTITFSDGETQVDVTGVALDATSVAGTDAYEGLTLTLEGTLDATLAATVTIENVVSTAATFANGDIDEQAFAAAGIDVSSRDAANSAVTTIQSAIDKVSAERSKLGAMQNRLEHTISNLGTSAENLQAAESRIRDLDMAEEIMAFTKNNILQQAATAMLAQANMAPQSVLQLLG